MTLELLQDIRSLTKDEAATLDSYKKTWTKYDEQRQKLFRACFKTWIEWANAQWDPTTRLRDVQHIIDALTHHANDPKTSPLSGKRLAITPSYHCALVPEESRESDIVAMLVNRYKHVILRPKQVNDVDHLNDLITRDFEQANISDCPQGPMKTRCKAVDDYHYDEWMLVWEKATQLFPVQHCLLLGQCYVDQYVPWKRGLPTSGFRVFALY
ncbi:uncharacterized protein FFB20_02693 [Fusarium fujikuroi]|uniref:Uncharacterized protein n=1 Tax=Gibberella fujikuroi (strain CBS 195.34 / IMI 58289 / NRRL A-6831) TaxID=1279085 RepID=S0E7G5_GIBF5|nr:uncharacterized protein FFUJ_06564 [Fusarium fujikuroi IMI 58289]SCN67631.1 uncharacterized protein FFB20_02693 [Fusarium fujikuroi]CCT70580.1 uncharacterized protein FFUJ_06564 [Fusarium fujikuroi IMI 58289]SCN83457.1 uncharacterized protein FFM5_03030 [Fusarium fujikuroi]SCN86250.1 uncharacterized protein FFC1_05103 [Fusarium fujikuroi]SCO23595.1 uncharacterized protein FFE2_15659 [Fusarium fujikuroi]